MTDDLFGWGQFIGSIATTGALIVLAVQTYFNKKQIGLTTEQVRQTQVQMDAKLRPWIGNVDAHSPWIWDRGDPPVISVYLKNYGDTVASSCDIRSIITAQEIGKKEIISLEPYQGDIILPQTEQELGIRNYDEVSLPKTEADQFFVGFLMEYVYGSNKKGACGFVAKYEPLASGKKFLFEDYWLS
ncbi:MAG: hypothetical protein WAM14_07740 [Candidatus Nitrosopolaris sp.]